MTNLIQQSSGVRIPDGHFARIPYEAAKGRRPSERRTPL